MFEKPFWKRSGFWPQVGTTLVLLGSYVGGEIELVALVATVLTSWGIFLGAAKASPSVPAKDVQKAIDVQVEALEKVQADSDAWRGRTR